MDIRESQAILIIILRNLSLPAWKNLMPEAQTQILEECAILMSHEVVTKLSKQKLSNCLNELQYHTSNIHRKRIQQILLSSDRFSVEDKKIYQIS